MINRRKTIICSIAVLATAMAVPALGAPAALPFTAVAFEAAQKSGKSILVEIHADWCPTCKAQAPIISQLRDDPRYKDLLVFRVDFDAQKDVVRQFGARSQSTLITFKGQTETGRSVGDTRKESIQTLLSQAL